MNIGKLDTVGGVRVLSHLLEFNLSTSRIFVIVRVGVEDSSLIDCKVSRSSSLVSSIDSDPVILSSRETLVLNSEVCFGATILLGLEAGLDVKLRANLLQSGPHERILGVKSTNKATLVLNEEGFGTFLFSSKLRRDSGDASGHEDPVRSFSRRGVVQELISIANLICLGSNFSNLGKKVLELGINVSQSVLPRLSVHGV